MSRSLLGVPRRAPRQEMNAGTIYSLTDLSNKSTTTSKHQPREQPHTNEPPTRPPFPPLTLLSAGEARWQLRNLHKLECTHGRRCRRYDTGPGYPSRIMSMSMIVIRSLAVSTTRMSCRRSNRVRRWNSLYGNIQIWPHHNNTVLVIDAMVDAGSGR